MCGIVGIINGGQTLRTAIEALKRLEYRGYDSFGVSVLRQHSIVTRKAIGSVIEHDKDDFFRSVPDGACTIAHTRWATHGKVTENNAHPHVSYDGAFSIVHNGVIENYRDLREELEAKGIKFSSETDSETVAHLLADQYAATKNVLEAFRCTIIKLRGEFAVVFTTVHDPKHLYGARFKSPLGYSNVDGIGIIASDQQAIGPLTSSMAFLEDGDVLVISPTASTAYQLTESGSLAEVSRSKIVLPWTGDAHSLNGHQHHMIKEIHESPTAARNAFLLEEDHLQDVVDSIIEKDLSIAGAGSAFYVAQIGQYYFAHLADTYARVHPSDEILSLVSFNGQDHLIAVSQSGETFDTLEAMRAALRQGSIVTSINNVHGSSSQRLATHSIFQGAGTEICVLSTKSVVSQTLILYRLAKLLGKKKGIISDDQLAQLAADEKRFPDVLHEVFEKAEAKIKKTAGWNRHIDNWFFIGRDIHYPVAMESALKFKEVSYRHAEGMSAGFFKHGTISLIDENFYTVAFLPEKSKNEDVYRYTVSNISEIHARGGCVIAIGHNAEIGRDVGEVYDYICLPSINEFLDPILELVAGQLLAYYCAASLSNRNIDKPRALAKAVTVR